MPIFHMIWGLLGLQPLLIYTAICMPIERAAPLRRRVVLRSGWRTDIAYILINGLFVRMGLFFPILFAAHVFRTLLPSSVIAAVSGQPVWLQIIEAILIGDLSLYWAHRALHANRHLWRFHAVHHAIKEVDWVAAYHSHPIDSVILAGAGLAATTAVGLSGAAISGYLLVFGFMSVVVHLNTRLKIGPLRWVLGSPEFHHWHHGNQGDVHDRNFASIIAFWDILFGTAYLPRNLTPQLYGINDDMPDSYVGQLFYPLVRASSEDAEGAKAAR